MDRKAMTIKALIPPLVRSVISPLGTIRVSAKSSSNQSDAPMIIFAYFLSIRQGESDSEKTNGGNPLF
jgi:hypothetical protein